MQPVILISLSFVAISVAQRFSTTSDWDPTQRDKTELCDELAQYAPNSDIYCKQFTLCCNSNFDPNNGDKCQHKEMECNVIEGQTRGEGTCVLHNCTEMITTTSRPLRSRTSGVMQDSTLSLGFLSAAVLLPMMLLR